MSHSGRRAATLTCAFAKVRLWAMSEQEALQEARRRWGDSGTVQSNEPTRTTRWFASRSVSVLVKAFALGDRVTRGKKRSPTPTARFAITRADDSIINS